MRPENRTYVSALETCAATAMEDMAGIGISDRDRRLDAIFSSTDAPITLPQTRRDDEVLPRSLSRFLGADGASIPWKTVVPGFKQWDLGEQDQCDVHMYWIKPGGKMPSHTHEGTELFLVVDGSFSDETGTYGPGDISIADESIDHRPIAGLGRPCIGFAVNDAPLRLTGSLGQRIGMLFGI